MQTIKQIRTIQVACQIGLFIIGITAIIFMGAILRFYHLPSYHGNLLGNLFLAMSVLVGFLLLVLRRTRCPVCSSVYVGRKEPQFFSVTCRNCGRRSGDTH